MRGIWRPTKEDIKEWWKTKEIEFTVDQHKNLRISVEEWLKRYVFMDLH
jgi:hypothetical protein